MDTAESEKSTKRNKSREDEDDEDEDEDDACRIDVRNGEVFFLLAFNNWCDESIVFMWLNPYF